MLLIAGPAILFSYQIIKKIYKHIKIDRHEESGVDDHIHILGFPVLVVTIFIMLLVSDD